jgi:hypothetical protein
MRCEPIGFIATSKVAIQDQASSRANEFMEALMADTWFVRKSIAEQARRLRRQADAYDELLQHRLAERGEALADFASAVELPNNDEVLIDTALYHAAAERRAAGRALIRRERVGLAALGAAAVAVILTVAT